MSFITQFFIKPAKPLLIRMPTGSFTISSDGKIMTSTMPQSFPTADLCAIGVRVLAAFRSAERAKLPLAELVVHYPKLKLVARGARSGAMVFFVPQ
jgi:hypothetical protein